MNCDTTSGIFGMRKQSAFHRFILYGKDHVLSVFPFNNVGDLKNYRVDWVVVRLVILSFITHVCCSKKHG